MNQSDWEKLWLLSSSRFGLGKYSLHGPDHWQRVEQNAIKLALDCNADELVVRLFAVLHDSKRLNESHDPEHGLRAANWAKQLRGEYFKVSDAQFDLLTEACVWHDKGKVSVDPTIGSCWDADRLDLPRVGISPSPNLMSTELGKALATGRKLF